MAALAGRTDLGVANIPGEDRGGRPVDEVFVIQTIGTKNKQPTLPVLWVFIVVVLMGEDLRRLRLGGWPRRSFSWVGVATPSAICASLVRPSSRLPDESKFPGKNSSATLTLDPCKFLTRQECISRQNDSP